MFIKADSMSVASSLAILLMSVPVHAGFRPVVVTGDASPDNNGVLSSFRAPSLNDNGQVAFIGRVSGPVDNDSGVFRASATPGGLALIAREGQAAPDGNGVFQEMHDFGNGNGIVPLINNAGQVAFSHITVDNAVYTGGIFRGAGNPLDLVPIIRNGQAAPDGNGFFAPNISTFALNDAGAVAFLTDFSTTSNAPFDHQGIYRGDGTTLHEVVRIPTPIEVGINSISSNPSMNALGHTAFSVNSAGGGIAVAGSGGVGITIPTASAGDLLINDAGQVGYQNYPVTFMRDATTIASAGQPIPEGGGTLNLGTIGFAMNNLGQLSFWATSNEGGGGDQVLLRGDGVDPLLQIARTGDMVPNGGATFYTFGGPAALNDTGQMAFLANILLDGGNTITRGIYLYDDESGLAEVIRIGESALGGIIGDLLFANGINNQGSHQSNKASGFNEDGHIAFGYSLLGGGSGIAIWSPGDIIQGDLDGDGFVGITDLNIVLGAWNQTVTSGDLLSGDPNGDGFVGIEDLNYVLGNWNAGTPPGETANIPEPGSAFIAVFGLISLAGRRAVGYC